MAVYDKSCPDGETLSEAVTRWRHTQPWVTLGVIATLVVHLLDLVPDEIDPVHILADALPGRRRKRLGET